VVKKRRSQRETTVAKKVGNESLARRFENHAQFKPSQSGQFHEYNNASLASMLRRGVQQTLQTEPETDATVDDNEKFRKMTKRRRHAYDITEKNGYKSIAPKSRRSD
jgi:hypothetical protein